MASPFLFRFMGGQQLKNPLDGINCIARYNFDVDTNAGFIDESSYQNTATPAGPGNSAVITTVGQKYGTGALLCTGGRIQLLNLPNVTNSMAVAGWFRRDPPAVNGDRLFFFSDAISDGNGTVAMFVNLDGQIQAQAKSVNNELTIIIGPTVPEGWFHAYFAYDAGKLYLAVNGAMQTMDITQGAVAPRLGYISIGGAGSYHMSGFLGVYGPVWCGAIDNFCVFDGVLFKDNFTPTQL